ncbi:MAG TPA: extracellular solute-binding protein, partial [Mesotoga infera]|nr:extracellular solute-binding protein [Mesotoga infera]
GATFWDESGEKIVFEEAQLEALKFITDAVKVEKVYVPEFGSRWTGFKQIKQAMVFGHGAMVGSFLSTGSKDLVFKTALAPAHPVTGSRANVITNWALVIMSDADDSEAAAKWLTYITSADAQKKWMLKTGELPSLKKVLEDPELLSNDLYVPIFESLKYAVPTFSRGWADPASELREIAYNEIINNNMDPKAALEKAIKEINIYLEETFSQF